MAWQTQRWEYLLIFLSPGCEFQGSDGHEIRFGKLDSEEEMLQECGVVGWELTTIHTNEFGGITYYFKRPMLHEVKA